MKAEPMGNRIGVHVSSGNVDMSRFSVSPAAVEQREEVMSQGVV